MDVDDIQPTRYSPFINFFDVSSNFPWQEPRPEQIRLRRGIMDGTLIFDILLNSGGIENTYSLYPPENQGDLQKLLDTIELSNYDTLKKDCLVYFLLKWHQDGRERNFQLQRCIPPQFAALADAYWHLDTGINVPRAVALLSDSRLNRDYASKIIRTISLSPDSAALVRRYVQTAKPQLIEPLDIECYALALAESSVTEAWQFFRTFNEADEMRGRLFRKILIWAVTPTPRPIALKALLTLPFSQVEESTLFAFVQKPPETLEFTEVAILQDLVCVRLIQAGRYTEAIKLDRQFTSVTSPKNLRITKDRSKMVNEVYAALPAVERSLLDLELDPSFQQKTPLAPKPVSLEMRRPTAKEPANTSLSQSWEDVSMPDALVNKSTPLRDVRPPLVTPTFGASSRTSTPAHGPPILPINFSGIASGSRTAPRKSLPLSSSLLGSSQMRSSLSGLGNRMAFGGNSAIASPASGMKIPGITTTPSHASAPTFVSAERQQNAFYQPPPPKTNGVKRAFEEDTTPRSPEHANVSANTADNDAEMEIEQDDNSFEREKRRGRKSVATEEGNEEENPLQYSVFESKKETKATKPSKKATHKAPPGSFLSDNEDAMDEDQEDDSNRRKRTSKTSTRPSRSQATTKPPAKKPRQTKQVRNIPGGLMEEEDEEEEEDEVAPLRAPSPPRRPVRKARSSASVEATDDYEGVQTRRRSSRLTTGGSAHGGSPEPQAPKVKKTARTSGARKKR